MLCLGQKGQCLGMPNNGYKNKDNLMINCFPNQIILVWSSDTHHWWLQSICVHINIEYQWDELKSKTRTRHILLFNWYLIIEILKPDVLSYFSRDLWKKIKADIVGFFLSKQKVKSNNNNKKNYFRNRQELKGQHHNVFKFWSFSPKRKV